MIRLVVLGDPVSHSRSPTIHTAALQAMGIAGSYEARQVDEAGMRAAADDIRSGALTGANITTPHKHLAADLADRKSDLTIRLGAANTWWREGGMLVADNTDVDGVQYALGRLGAVGPILVLGAGGAAAAALVACAGHELFVSTRNEDRARQLITGLSVEARVVAWGTPVPGTVVVNATRLGMAGESLPPALLDEAAGLIDMPYGDRPTPAVRDAARRGIPFSPGLDMLVGQAVASFGRWTGVSVDPEVMIESIRSAR